MELFSKIKATDRVKFTQLSSSEFWQDKKSFEIELEIDSSEYLFAFQAEVMLKGLDSYEADPYDRTPIEIDSVEVSSVEAYDLDGSKVEVSDEETLITYAEVIIESDFIYHVNLD